MPVNPDSLQDVNPHAQHILSLSLSMVSVVWISLSANWSLYSVQAGLQVIIAVLCFVGIFVFTRLSWQVSSLDIARNRSVSLPSLLSIHTLSEVYDVIFLLRFRIFHRNHWNILAQCVIVLILSISTIVSGPIAKASTRLGTVVVAVQADGLQSNRVFDSITYGYVQWNETIFKLNKAGYPYDQLLDYLPDSRYDWVFAHKEWNSSWAMSCNKTESTPIKLYDTGNCTDVYTELPDLQDVFPPDNFSNIHISNFNLNEGLFHTNDGLLVMTGWTPNLENSTRETFGSRNLTFSVAAVLLSNLNQDSRSTNLCYFDRGEVGSSSYTLAQCEIRKIRRTDEVDKSAAYPDHRALSAVSRAYTSHFAPRIARQSTSNVSIAPLSPDELIRFYQAYMVSKDTFEQHPVTRSLSHKIQIPQISATFVAFAAIIILLDISGLLYILWFTWTHFDLVLRTPESKLDWAVQSISEAPITAPTAKSTPVPDITSHRPYSVIAASAGTNVRARKLNRLRAFFEGARYGSNNGVTQPQESVPLTHFSSPMGAARSGPFESTQSHRISSPDGDDPQQRQEPSFYNFSPDEARFVGDPPSSSYFVDQQNRNSDYFVDSNGNGYGNTSSSGIWNSLHGYQRIGRPDA